MENLKVPVLRSALFLLLAISAVAFARPVQFSGVLASGEIPQHEAGQLIDGNVDPENGWGVAGNSIGTVEAVVRTKESLTAGLLLFSVVEISRWCEMPAMFDLAVTADALPSIEGNWTPVNPEFAAASQTAVAIEGMAVRPNGSGAITVYATAPFAGITGFRLRMLPVDNDGNPATPSVLGRVPGGPVGLTEFTVEADPLRSSNVAFGRPVTTSGRLHRNMLARFLTDGFEGTFSHPARDLDTDGFFYEVDLGQSRMLDHIVIRGRGDGVAPERLTRYEVQILDGDERELRWSAMLHPGGSHPGNAGSDVIRRDAGKGRMEGRFVRLVNRSGIAYSPQIAEVEVYPALRIQAEGLVADGVNASNGTIPAGTRRLGFRIALAENIVPTEQAAFRWRIEGADAAWRDVDWRGVVEAECPLPGSWMIAVQARHTDGIWDENGASLSLRVEFPWWKNRAVIVGFILIATALAGWVIRRIALLRLQRKVIALEHEQALNRERERIAQDMHDDVGAQLASLSLLAERCVDDPSALPTLGERARSAVASLDEIVWSVNPRHDTLGALADYLCKFAQEFLETASIRCRLQISVGERERIVESAMRHNILMTVKESLNNASRHSGASEVWLRLREDADSLVVEISDAGRGIPDSASAPNADGLRNLRKRVQEMSGKLEILTSPDSGTTIRIIVALSPI